MLTANTSVASPNGARFQLLHKFNSGATPKKASIYLKNDSLKHEIEKLKLEKGAKFSSLFIAFDKDWEGATTFLVHAASTPHQVTEESNVVQLLADRLRHVVEKHRSAHLQDIVNEQVFKQHLQAVSGVVVEAVYEIGTGSSGAFALALFGSKCRELAAKITQKKRATEKDLANEICFWKELCEDKNDKIATLNVQHSKFNAMHQETCKTKDGEIASLNQQLSEFKAMHEGTCKQHEASFTHLEASQLRNGEYGNHTLLATSLSHYKKRAETAELKNITLKKEMDGMVELRDQLQRAKLGKDEAHSEIGVLRDSVREEQGRYRKMHERLAKKTKELEGQLKVAEGRAESALKHTKSMPQNARAFVQAGIDSDRRVKRAQEFAEQEQRTAQREKRIAQQEIKRATLWKEEYNNYIIAQKKALDRMPHTVRVLFQPYIASPSEISNAEFRIERKITLSGL